MAIHHAHNRFNSGELTPYLAHAVDFDKYPSGAAHVENFLPMPWGGMRKRPGLRHLFTLPTNFIPSRILAMRYTDGDPYLFVFGLFGDVRVYGADGTYHQELAVDYANPLVVQTLIVNDYIYLVAPDQHPKIIARDSPGADSWTLTDLEFAHPPLLDENLDEGQTITVDYDTSTPAWSGGTAYAAGDRVTHLGDAYAARIANIGQNPALGGTFPYTTYHPVWNGSGWYYQAITVQLTIWRRIDNDPAAPEGAEVSLESNVDLFDVDHVGAYWEISQKRDSFETTLAATATGTSPSLVVDGGWQFDTFGTWSGTFRIQRLDADGTWRTVRTYSASADRNVSVEGESDGREVFRLTYTLNAAGSSNPKGILTAKTPYLTGLVRITAVTDAQNATAEVVKDVEQGTTWVWREGAFSDFRGYPRAIGLYDRRLIFAGTESHDVSLWLSKTDDLHNFQTGTEDDASIFVTLASVRQHAIQWLASQKALYVGTARDEWVIGSDDIDVPITPSNIVARQHTNYGSYPIQALPYHDGIFFVERQGFRIREFAYRLERENYGAGNMTRLAEHITKSGIREIAWQMNREPMLWVVRFDGVALSFAYHREEGIAAWTRHTTEPEEFDGFMSVAILRNDLHDDTVFFIVKRDIGEAVRYSVEYLALEQQTTQEAGDIAKTIHLDCSVHHDGSPTDTITVPAALANRDLVALVDGIALSVESTGTTVTLAEPASVITVGLPYTARFSTFSPDLQIQDGSTLGRRKRIHEVLVDVFQSFGGQIVYDGHARALVYQRNPTVDPSLVTGWIPSTLSPAHMDDLTWSLEHSEPFPFTFRTTVTRWEVHEP